MPPIPKPGGHVLLIFKIFFCPIFLEYISNDNITNTALHYITTNYLNYHLNLITRQKHETAKAKIRSCCLKPLWKSLRPGNLY